MSDATHEHLQMVCKHAEVSLQDIVRSRKLAIKESSNLEEHKKWASKLHTAILTYAQAANMAVISRILNLPRELRDSIYIQLFAVSEGHDPRRDLLYWWECFDQPWFRLGDDIHDSPWLTTSVTGIRPPHFIDPAFVGTQFAKENLKLFRMMMGKDMRLENDKNPIAEFTLMDESAEDFVGKDAFGVGMTMQTLTDNLDLCVNFQCDSMDFGPNDISFLDAVSEGYDATSISTESVSRTESHITRRHIGDLHTGVLALCTLSFSNRVIIQPQRVDRPKIVTIVVRQEFSSYKALMITLQLITNLYHSLKKKGFVLRVQYRSEEIGLKVVFGEDVTTWTEDDWRTNFTDRNTSQADQSMENVRQQRVVWNMFKKTVFGIDVDANVKKASS